MKVYVVVGQEGEYSDQHAHAVATFTDEAAADAFVAKADARQKEVNEVRRLRQNRGGAYDYDAKGRNEYNIHSERTPSGHYWGDCHSFEVQECELDPVMP